MRTTSARERLRLLGQGDLGAWIEVSGGGALWSRQKTIAQELSHYRARVAVPSCNASGKTWLAGRLALAFYDSYTPGTACMVCDPTGTKGGCLGAKVITMSSKFEHLKDNLWGELRMAYPDINKRIQMDGTLAPRDLWIRHQPEHFIIGQATDTAEGLQGYHAAHKLILGDEATSASEEVSQGITSLLASGDSRLLLIFNPTTDETYAAKQTRSAGTKTIKITAFDTPHFTGEPVPPASNLITPRFLAELEEQGMGPGTYEWTTRVLAEFWGMSDDTLINSDSYDKALKVDGYAGVRQLGVDIAPYGTSENTIAVRDGNTVVEIRTFPAMRPDLFFQGPVTAAVRDYDPDYLVYDADGVGAGAIGYAEALPLRREAQLIPFRGALGAGTAYSNTRSAWWWALRQKFDHGQIKIAIDDPKTREQLTGIHYSIQAGKIRVETKAEMRKRGVPSPDRGDAIMYAFAMSEDLAVPAKPMESVLADEFGVGDHSVQAMWDRWKDHGPRYTGHEDNAVLGIPD
ncbi:MAG TPA: hypothetical protein VNM39_15250 [Verrucomicrobiae bacterium]|nr:hypothetical protein [Verrucomicrobiae bacterium]